MRSYSDFDGLCVAHRGLHDNTADHVENTLAAFQRAVDAGYGIELDVRLTRDDKLIVAHDVTAQRLCGVDAAFRDIDYDDLRELRVLGSSQHVPLFVEVLDLVGGRVPLVVEIKPEVGDMLTCRLTDQALAGYDGPYCIESFDPRVLWWYRWHRPDVLRGQLSEDYARSKDFGLPVLNGALTKMLFNAATWPDFIAYNWKDAARPSLHWWRRVLRCPLVAWTIESQAQLDAARHTFDTYIFQGFIPDQPDQAV